MNNIRIKPYFTIILHSPNMVELRHGVWNSMSHMINDENNEGVLGEIILSLDGQLSPSAIADKLGIGRTKIEAVIDYLQQLGVLQIKSESFVDYYIDNATPTLRRPGKYKYQIAMPVVFVGDGYINNKIKDQLAESVDIEVIDGDDCWAILQKSGDNWLFDALEQEKLLAHFKNLEGKFLVYSSRHVNPILATRINRIAHVLNVPWLHLAIDGPFVFIGPTFHGGQGSCYDCFETRVGMNLRESESYQKYKNAIIKNQVHVNNDDPLLSVTSNLVATHAAMEILNYLITQCAFTTNKILSIFMPTMEFIYHDYMRLPSCRTCGSQPHRDETQLYFDFQSLIGEVA